MNEQTIAGPCLAHFGAMRSGLDLIYAALESKKAVCDCCGWIGKWTDGDLWGDVRICPDCGRDLREVEG